MARDRYDVNELLERAKKQREELSKIERLLSSRERRFHRAFLVTLDEQQYLYAVCFAAPMSESVSAQTVIQNAMLVSDYFNDIWITENSQGNLIGYGTKEVTKQVYSPDAALRSGRVPRDYENVVVTVPIETEEEYKEALDGLKRDGIIIELTDLIIEEVEYLYQLGKIYRDRLREIEERRIEAIEEQVPQPQASIYTGGWWEALRKDAEVYAMLKKGVKDDEEAKKIIQTACAVIAIVASLAIPEPLLGALISKAITDAGVAATSAEMNKWAERELGSVEKEVIDLLRVEGVEPWYDPDDPKGSMDIARSFYGGYASYEEAQEVFKGLVLDPSALQIRNYQIEKFLPYIKDLAELSYSELANENRSKGLGVPGQHTGGTGDLAFDTKDWWATGGKIKGYISGLMAILFDQPNSLIMAYELAKKYVFPDVVNEKKDKELKSVLSEYVDQSHWRLVPDVRAIYAWAKVLNLTPGQFKLIAPDEDFIRLKKVTYHPLITELKQWINFFTGGDPGNEWFNMYYQKLLSESKELGLGGTLPEEPVDAGVLVASGYGITQGVAAASYTRGADYSKVGGEVPSAPSVPTIGYGAGFLGIPSGGEFTTTSGEDTTTASSLSMPSFPPVGLPGLGAGPSALPSPLGLGGVVGGVPSTPSGGLPSIGWDGAAMPTPSLGSGGLSGGSAPAPPSRGGFARGGLGAGFNLGGGLTGGAFPSGGGMPDLGGGAGMGGGGVGGGFNLGGLGAGASATPSFPTSMPGAGNAEQSLSRAEGLIERLMQIPDQLSTTFASLGQGGGFMGGLLGEQLGQQQMQRPQIVHRFEKGSIQIHTKKMSPQKIFSMFLARLREESRQGEAVA